MRYRWGRSFESSLEFIEVVSVLAGVVEGSATGGWEPAQRHFGAEVGVAVGEGAFFSFSAVIVQPEFADIFLVVFRYEPSGFSEVGVKVVDLGFSFGVFVLAGLLDCDCGEGFLNERHLIL